ncbi:uncharacterized protein ACRADG_005110 [Cochliomyia hominivorax]
MAKSAEINTFVVFDLETNGLPSEQFNKCSITEISLYAFSAKCLTEREIDTKLLLKDVNEEGVEGYDLLPPELPRVLHKLTLMVNPRCMIFPSAERVTGLSNEMLENESSFDQTTTICLNSFLERLHKPICMVAHNGWSFDYPIIRHVYEKINEKFPSSIYCVDSLKAFREIDEKYDKIKEAKRVLKILVADENELIKHELHNNEKAPEEITIATIVDSNSKLPSDPLDDNSRINWQHDNETTPQRKNIKTEKRNYSTMIKDDIAKQQFNDLESPEKKRSVSFGVKRSLFTDNFQFKKKYPPKGVYKLGNIYRRCFNQEPVNLHRAESDVNILTKLILHYGLDFLAYAEERKETFDKIPKLGSKIN